MVKSEILSNITMLAGIVMVIISLIIGIESPSVYDGIHTLILCLVVGYSTFIVGLIFRASDKIDTLIKNQKNQRDE